MKTLFFAVETIFFLIVFLTFLSRGTTVLNQKSKEMFSIGLLGIPNQNGFPYQNKEQAGQMFQLHSHEVLSCLIVWLICYIEPLYDISSYDKRKLDKYLNDSGNNHRLICG